MDQVDVFKALSNKKRLEILAWLKEPEKHFPKQECGQFAETGVCVGHIQQKSGLTQSTVSEYLSMLQRANLLIATRMGQWTHYKRNEDAIRELGTLISEKL
jgi:DNA-binding transcriptional ArsR family regulator